MDVNASTKLLSVIGNPIEHSMSPSMHNAAIKDLGLNYIYVAFKVEEKNLATACNGFRSLGIKGINVTIPHKVAIIKYLDEIDPIAKGIGAINTIKNEDGILRGKNTDGEGFLLSLKNAEFDPKNKKCLILGAGGASRAISFILGTTAREIAITDLFPDVAETLKKNLDTFYSQKNISDIIGYEVHPKFRHITLNPNYIANELEDTDLLINATPVGMYPNINQSPLDYMNITLKSNLFVFDAVYNPLETKFLKNAKSFGCKTLSGINMLVNQGAAAFEWWTGKKPNLELMKSACMKKLKIE